MYPRRANPDRPGLTGTLQRIRSHMDKCKVLVLGLPETLVNLKKKTFIGRPSSVDIHRQAFIGRDSSVDLQ